MQRIINSRIANRITVYRPLIHIGFRPQSTWQHEERQYSTRRTTVSKEKKKSSKRSSSSKNNTKTKKIDCRDNEADENFTDEQLDHVQSTVESFVQSLDFRENVNRMKKVEFVRGATEEEMGRVEYVVKAFEKLLHERKQRAQWDEQMQRDMVVCLYLPLAERMALLQDSIGSEIEQEAGGALLNKPHDRIDKDQIALSQDYFQRAFEVRCKMCVIIDRSIGEETEHSDTLHVLKRDILGRMAFHLLRKEQPLQCVALLDEVLSMYDILDRDLDEIEDKMEGFEEIEDTRRATFAFSNGALCHLILGDSDRAEHYFNAAELLATKYQLVEQLELLNKTRPQIFAGIRGLRE